MEAARIIELLSFIAVRKKRPALKIWSGSTTCFHWWPSNRPTTSGASRQSIALAGSRWQGAGLDVETTNGGVRMELPANYNAELHTETHNGGIDIDFPVTVRGRLSDMRRRIDTTIGSGGAPLRVRTVNGGVSIASR